MNTDLLWSENKRDGKPSVCESLVDAPLEIWTVKIIVSRADGMTNEKTFEVPGYNGTDQPSEKDWHRMFRQFLHYCFGWMYLGREPNRWDDKFQGYM